MRYVQVGRRQSDRRRHDCWESVVIYVRSAGPAKPTAQRVRVRCCRPCAAVIARGSDVPMGCMERTIGRKSPTLAHEFGVDVSLHKPLITDLHAPPPPMRLSKARTRRGHRTGPVHAPRYGSYLGGGPGIDFEAWIERTLRRECCFATAVVRSYSETRRTSRTARWPHPEARIHLVYVGSPRCLSQPRCVTSRFYMETAALRCNK